MSSLSIEHETRFVQSFIVREKRERYLLKLASPKRRTDFLDRLNHVLHKDWDERYVVGEVGSEISIPSTVTSCYLIAYEAEYDGRFVSPAEVADVLALAEFGVIVSVLPGQLAYYKDEPPSKVILLRRD